jgi:hypothetical protein
VGYYLGDKNWKSKYFDVIEQRTVAVSSAVARYAEFKRCLIIDQYFDSTVLGAPSRVIVRRYRFGIRKAKHADSLFCHTPSVHKIVRYSGCASSRKVPVRFKPLAECDRDIIGMTRDCDAGV